MREIPLFFAVEVKNGQIYTRTIDSDDVSHFEEVDVTVLKSRKDWENLKEIYEDMFIDREMKVYPELNSLFSYLLTLLIDENSKPLNSEVVLFVSLKRRLNN